MKKFIVMLLMAALLAFPALTFATETQDGTYIGYEEEEKPEKPIKKPK